MNRLCNEVKDEIFETVDVDYIKFETIENDDSTNIVEDDYIDNDISDDESDCVPLAKAFKTNSESESEGSHDENMLFKCRVCWLQFKLQIELEEHMKVHDTQEESHLCDICGKGSNTKNNLKKHMIRCHTDTRTIACEYCPKRFKSTLLLRQHTHIHTGVKEFECQMCPKIFNTRDTLRRHFRKDHLSTIRSNPQGV